VPWIPGWQLRRRQRRFLVSTSKQGYLNPEKRI